MVLLAVMRGPRLPPTGPQAQVCKNMSIEYMEANIFQFEPITTVVYTQGIAALLLVSECMNNQWNDPKHEVTIS